MIANLITSLRIICSAALLFFPPFSPAFYIFYLTAGASDIADGMVARKANTVSEFGSRLDTVADFIFIAACLSKLLPVMEVPAWLWVWIGIIAVIKIINVVSGFIIHKQLAAEHTIMNKITGFLLFLLPLTLPIIDLQYSAVPICAAATFSAIQEGHFIRTGRKEKGR